MHARRIALRVLLLSGLELAVPPQLFMENFTEPNPTAVVLKEEKLDGTLFFLQAVPLVSDLNIDLAICGHPTGLDHIFRRELP